MLDGILQEEHRGERQDDAAKQRGATDADPLFPVDLAPWGWRRLRRRGRRPVGRGFVERGLVNGRRLGRELRAGRRRLRGGLGLGNGRRRLDGRQLWSRLGSGPGGNALLQVGDLLFELDEAVVEGGADGVELELEVAEATGVVLVAAPEAAVLEPKRHGKGQQNQECEKLDHGASMRVRPGGLPWEARFPR